MYKLISYLLVASASVIGGFFLGARQAPPPSTDVTPSFSSLRQPGYHFTNPLLDCELSISPESNAAISPIREKISSQINSKLGTEQVQEIAYYFRDLNNGPWFGINEGSVFTPASLLKTPMMITYLKLAESSPQILEEKIFFDNQKLEPSVAGLETLKPSSSYSVRELIERMIIYSDNDAFNLLTSNIDYQLVKKIHQDLGLPLPQENTPEDFITVKEYAGLFRVLYNASYLSREMSENALSVLSHAAYQDGLVRGVGEQVELAHKFGIRKGENGINQLHDCGIVYFPEHPYLICIMTKGSDIQALTQTLQDLSRITYEQVLSLYP